MLLCPESLCQREHPIIDGIPIIVANLRGYLEQQLADIRGRQDLSAFTESLLGDGAGPGSSFDQTRYRLSSYAASHYADLAPLACYSREPAGSLLSLLKRCFAALSSPIQGTWLDIGCALGRGTMEIASRTKQLALGVDINFSMLRLARKTMRTGHATYPLRKVGMVYEEKQHHITIPEPDMLDFWACDATQLPFSKDVFDGVCSVNVLDCTHSPIEHIAEAARVLKPTCEMVLATPYDWSVHATQIESWIGGHSQRSKEQGCSATAMRRLLSAGAEGMSLGLRLVSEIDPVPWRVYVHERASMEYNTHVLIAAAE